MKLPLSATLAAAALAMGAQGASAAPTLQYSGQSLTGIQDLTVDGTDYDVRFVYGSCADVFGTCATSSFTFTTEPTAATAAAAIGAAGVTASAAATIPGCANVSSSCFIAVPFFATNPIDPIVEALVPDSGSGTVQTQFPFNSALVFALFDPVTTPEPGSLALLASGAVAGAVAQRRRRKR